MKNIGNVKWSVDIKFKFMWGNLILVFIEKKDVLVFCFKVGYVGVVFVEFIVLVLEGMYIFYWCFFYKG